MLAAGSSGGGAPLEELWRCAQDMLASVVLDELQVLQGEEHIVHLDARGCAELLDGDAALMQAQHLCPMVVSGAEAC